ncbi:putative myosin light chain TgMLC1 [Neospora caninum Liverpool]|uniref:Myosin light chain TgMLC1, putative n=1 Tax=Neospora caninum (strain Liverpool) TaxID=572307 RepID=F0VMZ8_NEOCL|nr:putative myosin light chain TgMLC1 [Neospora caninum Liverpool]CBZ55094.1 putative myosin light chain TgMLC1 [Neospora caninum Liverpool]CEL69820.1 TPA: myosin light chain TgMLC1, putative [Neospora caninum Liverpool]|eukprot:XP_003885122.1 putative myosin light chain TgMLC1 [Neospora caninum Liverpool]
MSSDADIQVAFQDCADGSKLPAAKLGVAARLAGASPSNGEVAEAAGKMSGGVDLAAFKTFCNNTQHKDDDLNDLKELFKAADIGGSGKIGKTAMKNMVQGYGEPLSDAEFEAAVKDFLRDNGENVDYATMLATILQS